jgi:predicted exporter
MASGKSHRANVTGIVAESAFAKDQQSQVQPVLKTKRSRCAALFPVDRRFSRAGASLLAAPSLETLLRRS